MNAVDDYRADVELCGLDATITQAADRAGCTPRIAGRILAELHARAGHSIRQTADIIGANQRTVERHMQEANGATR